MGILIKEVLFLYTVCWVIITKNKGDLNQLKETLKEKVIISMIQGMWEL